jgi:hypothetical protein
MSRRLVVALAALFVVMTSCSDDDGPEDYTAAVHDGVLEGCAEDDTDPDVVDVCECTYDTLTDELGFDEFERMENRLAQGEERLPDELADAVRSCIRSVSGDRAAQR